MESLPSHPIIDIIADMISLLKHEAKKRQLIPEDYIVFTRPDSINIQNNLLQYLRVAVHKGGLQDFGARFNRAASMGALYGMGKFDTGDPGVYFECEDNPFLVLHYSNSSLTTTIVKDEGMPAMVKDYLNLGADSRLLKSAPDYYWQNVKSTIKGFIHEQHREFGELVIFGSRAKDSKFLQVVQNVVEEGPIKIKIQATDEQVFAAARGAARSARMGLIDGWNACLPNDWCPTPLDDDQTADPKSEL